jgi:hypothetical protein
VRGLPCACASGRGRAPAARPALADFEEFPAFHGLLLLGGWHYRDPNMQVRQHENDLREEVRMMTAIHCSAMNGIIPL